MDQFKLNGILWRIIFVNPKHQMLYDRTGKLTVATTDPVSHIVYLSTKLRGQFLMRVFIHELGHCVMVSYDLIDQIHRMVKPEHWIEAEEWICNFISDYGMIIFSIAYSKLGYKAWMVVPPELEKLVS